MFIPISTEANDGRIRMGSIGIILACFVIHVAVSLDEGRRAGRMAELHHEVQRGNSDKSFEKLLEDVGGEDVFDDRATRDARASDRVSTVKALEAERKKSLMYRLALVAGDFNPINLITHQFVHGDWLHLIFNLWFFYIVGVTMEKYWGLGKFLGIYLACGILGALGFLILAGSKSQGIPLVGASGAIAGMMGAFAVTHGDAKVKMLWIFGFRIRFFSIPSRWYLGFWVAGQIIDTFVYSSQVSGVAFSAHVAGFLAGMVAGKKFPGDKFYEKAYTTLFSSEDIDRLASDEKLKIAKSPTQGPVHQDGSDVNTFLNRGLHKLEHGDSKGAGENMFLAMDKALSNAGLSSHLVEAALRQILEALPRIDLPPGAAYSWGRRLEQKDWWPWAIRFYDAAAADFSPGTSPHSRSSSLFRAATLRMDHGQEKDRAILGFQALLRGDPGGPMAAEAETRLASMRF